MLSGEERKPGPDSNRPARIPAPSGRRILSATEEANRRFVRDLVESSPDCVLVLDLEGRLLFVNSRGLRLMERNSFAPLRGRPWAGFWPAGEADSLRAAIAEARTGRTTRFSGYCPTARGRRNGGMSPSASFPVPMAVQPGCWPFRAISPKSDWRRMPRRSRPRAWVRCWRAPPTASSWLIATGASPAQTGMRPA